MRKVTRRHFLRDSSMLALGSFAVRARANGWNRQPHPLITHPEEQSAWLEAGFRNPPLDARPQTWWHWVNGHITREGITLDLEAMARVGLGGAEIFSVDVFTPPGPVKALSPEWYDMLFYAASEANRLGLKLGMHNCPGWSSSGAPCVTPPHAMQRVTISETRLSGPSHFKGPLSQPETKLNFYRDIAVLAFPSLESGPSMETLAPTVKTAAGVVDGGELYDGRPDTGVFLPLPENGDSYLQFDFPVPPVSRTIELTLTPAGWARNVQGVVQISSDGEHFRDLQSFVFPKVSDGSILINLGRAVDTIPSYRIRFTKGGHYVKLSPKPQLQVTEVSFSSALRVGNADVKSGMNQGDLPKEPGSLPEKVPDGLAVMMDVVIDISNHLSPDGTLDWSVPPGSWTILRIGSTPTGHLNRQPAEGGAGLECDKLSPAGADAVWKCTVQKALEKLGPLAGKDRTFNKVAIDSYEVGGQNWTLGFRDAFEARRGYDPLPWLISLTGRVVESPALTERFLWDMRRTIADLFAENYYGRFRELCHRNGLELAVEPYVGPFESLQCGGQADIPVGEFWVGVRGSRSLRLAASVGHIYGRPIIEAESFTANAKPNSGKWQSDPASLKPYGDLAFSHGINRLVFHTYAHQPWTDRWPGMTMGMWGTHFGRTNTWWEQGRAWISYLSRCQHLLQQGRFAADVAAFYGEGAPVMNPEDPGLPPGYDYDAINAEILLHQAAIENGELVLHSGMRYRVLALCAPDPDVMSPELLGRLHDLVKQGMTLVGSPPKRAPGLSAYPQCDEAVQSLVAEMWGKCDGKTITEQPVGKGRVIWGQPLASVLEGMDIPPDFEYPGNREEQITYIHRIDGDTDIYFVANPHNRPASVDCTFRVSKKSPEFWHPDSGKMEPAAVWNEQGGRITLPLQLDPNGSVFVVFRKKNSEDHVVTAEYVAVGGAADALIIHKALYGSADGSRDRDVGQRIRDAVSNGALNIDVSNRTMGGDPAPGVPKRLLVEYTLNGVAGKKSVKEKAVLNLSTSTSGNSRWAKPRLRSDPDGALRLCAVSPGGAELTWASGKTLKVQVDDVPASVTLTGPWKLDFPPNWGAPASVSLPKLISWTEHADNGVKYFSGTATYTQNVKISEERFGTGKSVWLDLGVVKNLAEVSVNGKDLGVLWKPPFCVEITGAARPGDNRIEIKVTNLWPNRLIGDEQLPPDCEWKTHPFYGGALEKFPQWFSEGKPGPTGRLTFATWNHWSKEDRLLPSGLLGPVTIYTEKCVPVSSGNGSSPRSAPGARREQGLLE